MFCPEIEIFPSSITEFADSKGRVILDISENTVVALQKALETAEEILKTNVTTKISLAVPNTAKNYFYLSSLFHPNAAITSDKITARVTTGTTTYMFDKLMGVSKNNAELELIFELESDYVKLLKETKVKDIGLPIFEFTKETVEARWSEDGLYQDDDAGYFFPIVNYGNWMAATRKTLFVEDLRPFLSPIYLLKKCLNTLDGALNRHSMKQHLAEGNGVIY